MLVGKTSRQDRGQVLSISFELSSKKQGDREHYPNDYFTKNQDVLSQFDFNKYEINASLFWTEKPFIMYTVACWQCCAGSNKVTISWNIGFLLLLTLDISPPPIHFYFHLSKFFSFLLFPSTKFQSSTRRQTWRDTD